MGPYLLRVTPRFSAASSAWVHATRVSGLFFIAIPTRSESVFRDSESGSPLAPLFVTSGDTPPQYGPCSPSCGAPCPAAGSARAGAQRPERVATQSRQAATIRAIDRKFGFIASQSIERQ